MSDLLKCRQFTTGLQLNIFDHSQVTVTAEATGEVMVNLVVGPDGYNLIFRHQSITDDQAISMAVLLLIEETDKLYSHLME